MIFVQTFFRQLLGKLFLFWASGAMFYSLIPIYKLFLSFSHFLRNVVNTINVSVLCVNITKLSFVYTTMQYTARKNIVKASWNQDWPIITKGKRNSRRSRLKNQRSGLKKQKSNKKWFGWNTLASSSRSHLLLYSAFLLFIFSLHFIL